MEKPVTGYLDGRSIGKVAGVLAGGGVAVLPTDTLYGFHCSIRHPAAIDTICALKGKRKGGGFILLASNIEMAGCVVSRWPEGVRHELSSIWPASLTAVLPASRRLPAAVLWRGAVAVRVPAHEELRLLIRRVGEPLVSTSVNRAGEEPLRWISAIRKAFPGLGAYISRRGGGSRHPSTVIDFRPKAPVTLRAGRYRFE